MEESALARRLSASRTRRMASWRRRPGRTMPRVPSEVLLLAIAQIAVVMAGFTAVTSALTPQGGSWRTGQRLRQRAIVSTSFNVVFESLLPVIAFAWFGDAHTALVLSSAAVALYTGWVVAFAGPAVSQDRRDSHAERPAALRPGPPRLPAVRGERDRIRVRRRLRSRAVRPAVRCGDQLLHACGGSVELNAAASKVTTGAFRVSCDPRPRTGCSEAWHRTCFGSTRSWVRIPPPRPSLTHAVSTSPRRPPGAWCATTCER